MVCTNAGRVKKPSAAATKQWARQVRRQQQAQEQATPDSPIEATQTLSQHTSQRQGQRSKLGQPQHSSATRTLLAAIHQQDQADKYIDRILRKQGGRLHKAKPPAKLLTGDLQTGKSKQRQLQHDSQGVIAELQSLGQQQPADEDIYDSEQDYYFDED